MAVTAAYPYVVVKIDTRGLQPKAARAVGNIGIVGDANGNGTAVPNIPVLISSESDARKYFATTDAAGAITDPVPCTGRFGPRDAGSGALARVRGRHDGVGGDPDYAGALAVLASREVQFVLLAEETDVGAVGPPPTKLKALKDHVESVSADGNRRIGVAMVDPTLNVAAGKTFAEAADDKYGDLRSDNSRMILVAGRVEVDPNGVPESDLAAAVGGTIAGYQPHISALLKQVRGLQIPIHLQFSPSEIKEISEVDVIPLIDPELIPGAGLFLGCGRTYTTDTSKLYIDIVRTLDHIEFQLKAGSIGSIGDVRIDRAGMQTLAGRIDAILSPLKRQQMIDEYSIFIPLLPILERQEIERTADEAGQVTTARLDRRVEVLLSITYGPQVHVLDLQVALKM